MNVHSVIFCMSAGIIVLLSFATENPALYAIQLSPDSTTTQRRYDSILTSIEAQRIELRKAYERAGASSTKDSLLEKARSTFVSSIVDRLAPEWFGTTWDFNGTTQTPREGTIACGYFVSTLLRDAGLKVERVKMAQQASERIVKTLAKEKEISRFSNVPIEEFSDSIQSLGYGLYVVGLDYHVGFLYHNGTDLRFIHSCYIGLQCVLSEAAKESTILSSSKYRVVGKISANNDLIRKWLLEREVKTSG